MTAAERSLPEQWPEQIGDRYREIAEGFNSIRDDAKQMVDQIADAPQISWSPERLSTLSTEPIPPSGTAVMNGEFYMRSERIPAMRWSEVDAGSSTCVRSRLCA